jgi:hypothetical protein
MILEGFSTSTSVRASMALYDVKINSYLGSDTRIQVVKCGNPKKESSLDRNSKYETARSSGTESTDCRESRARKAKRVRRARLSPNAKKTLQRIGGVVSALYAANESLFLTGTFPGSSFRTQSAIASESSWIVHRLKAWIYKRIGANIAYYVWEFQKRGTLHLHYVVLVPCPIARSQILADFREEWIRLIAGASARSGVNLFQGERGRDYFTEKEKLQIYVQECYKSASSYLSKYLAKGKEKDFPPPTRMWGCTREARHLVAASLISVEYCAKTLQKASDLAHDLDRESGTENDKRRFWHHRFSQGFTILLYNDTFRIDLSRIQESMNRLARTGIFQKAEVLRNELNSSGAIDRLKDQMSLPGWASLLGLLNPSSQFAPPFDPKNAAESLIEARILIRDMGGIGYRAKFTLKSKLAVLISELIEEYDLSVLRSANIVCPEDSGSDKSPIGVADLQCPRSQLQLSICSEN